MTERRYVDFDVAIEAVDDRRYRARVLDSPSGQARGEFEMPFSDLELENFLLRIGRPRSGVRRLESPEARAARDFGRKLFAAVFAGDVGTAWTRSLDAAEREDIGLRLRLRLADAPVLTELPWEYLYVPSSDRHLVLSTWTPLVRYIDLPKGTPPLVAATPLRLLAMVSSPTDFPALDTDAEWAKLDESLQPLEDAGLLEITRLERATLRDLARALRRADYHIFHYIGHGGFDEQADDGVLMLENDEGRGRKVTGRELGTILHDARSIRLAVLNACEGARTSLQDPMGGSAQSLVAGGIPAVVAMQFEISDRAAIVFAHELYGAVADGFPIDAALAEARRAIFGSGNDVEWGTPVLYMRTADGRLFDLVTPPAGGVPEKEPGDDARRMLTADLGPELTEDDGETVLTVQRADLESELSEDDGDAVQTAQPAAEQEGQAPVALEPAAFGVTAVPSELETAAEVEDEWDDSASADLDRLQAIAPAPLSAESEALRQEALEATLARAADAEGRGDWLTAVRCYEAVLTAAPEREDVALALDRARERMRAEELLAEALDLHERGELNEAADRWDELAAVAPEMVDVELREEALHAGVDEPEMAGAGLRDPAIPAGVDEPVMTVPPAPPPATTGAERPAQAVPPRRRPTRVLVALALAVLLLVAILALPGALFSGDTPAEDDNIDTTAAITVTLPEEEEPAGDGETLTAIGLSAPITVDGDGGDWPSGPMHATPHPEGDARVSSGWRLGWDDDALYMFVSVTDPEILVRNADQPGRLFNGDGVNFSFGADPAGVGPSTGLRPSDVLIMLGPSNDDADEAVAGKQLATDTPSSSPQDCDPGAGSFGLGAAEPEIDVAAARTPSGYDLEAAVPWLVLGQDPEAEAVFGMALTVADVDDDGSRRGSRSTLENRESVKHCPAMWSVVVLAP